MSGSHDEKHAKSVLLVEDNDDHAELASYHLRQAFPGAKVQRVETGLEALDSLRIRAESEELSQFDLVLLDLKLPQMSGLKVLEVIRGEPSIRATPVVMFTTSDAAGDKAEAHGQLVNGYVVKPTGHTQYKSLFQAISDFWLQHNRSLDGHP